MMHPVASPRDADARRRPRRLRRWARPRSRATRWASIRASAGTSSSTATSPAPGRSTATSCPTPRAWTACSGWSPRWSSRTPRPPPRSRTRARPRSLRHPVDGGMNAPDVASAPSADRDPALRATPRRTMLLATDLTPTSLVAETRRSDWRVELQAVLLVVSVIDPRSLRGPRGDFIQRMDQARVALQPARARAAGPCRRRRRRRAPPHREGEPAESVLEAAAAESVSMIVVGSHGRRGVDRLVLGSVSDQVVREAGVPVVVARGRSTAT